MTIPKKTGHIILQPFILLFGLSFLAVLVVASVARKLKKPMYMLTIDEQIEAINKEVALELCWAESYEECDQIIEKGKQRINQLSNQSQYQFNEKKSISISGDRSINCKL